MNGYADKVIEGVRYTARYHGSSDQWVVTARSEAQVTLIAERYYPRDGRIDDNMAHAALMVGIDDMKDQVEDWVMDDLSKKLAHSAMLDSGFRPEPAEDMTSHPLWSAF